MTSSWILRLGGRPGVAKCDWLYMYVWDMIVPGNGLFASKYLDRFNLMLNDCLQSLKYIYQ